MGLGLPRQAANWSSNFLSVGSFWCAVAFHPAGRSERVNTRARALALSAATLTAVVVVAAAVVAVASGAADSVSAVSVAPPQAVSAKAAAASMTSRLTGMPPRRAITVVGRRALAGDREPWPSGAVIGPVLGLYWACSGIRRMIDARSAQLSSVLTMDFSGSSPARVGAAAPGFVVLHTVTRGGVGAWWLWPARTRPWVLENQHDKARPRRAACLFGYCELGVLSMRRSCGSRRNATYARSARPTFSQSDWWLVLVLSSTSPLALSIPCR